ncbi:hypothetical protein [uncultured Roseobacter sp.]|uniref:hypothetical protein n=1 Tax=uncultured Roseobacter sp. TaxID=114847 RepID=UPI0026300114|nr:hypothetical protein [uncultured Roseobacter sp.]
MSPTFLFGPVLAGYAFQQTALVSMVPVFTQLLGLSESQVGLSVAAGLLLAGLGPPFVGLLGGSRVMAGALWGLMLGNLALLALLGVRPEMQPAGLILAALVLIRSVQGLSFASLMMLAQQASFQTGNGRKTLAAVQSTGSLGRIAAALSVGPLLVLSPLAPLLPGVIGALVSLVRARKASAPPLRSTLRPPGLGAFRVVIFSQMAVGAAQIGLAPLVMVRLDLSATAAAGMAGLCLAAAHAGLFLALRLLVPRAKPTHARLVALGLLLAAGGMTQAAHPAAFLLLSFVIGASTASLFTLSLSDILTRKDFAQLQVAGWNGTVQIVSLALGVAVGAALLALSPAAPFAVAGLCGVVLALFPSAIERT